MKRRKPVVSLLAASAAGLMLSATSVFAVDSGPTVPNTSCMQKVFGSPVSGANKLNCTANDIRLSRAISVSPEKCTAGLKFNLTATFETVVTANARYDGAFFFRTDGGANARGDGTTATGSCSVSQLNTNGPGLNLDGDSCGDLNAGTYNVTFTIPDVLCQDTNGDGFLNLPNCTSWHSNQGTACSLDTNVADANPDTKSKCVCDDTFQVPVLVEEGTISALKDVTPNTPSSRPEPGGEFQYTISVKNTASAVNMTLDRICDDQYGTIAVATRNPPLTCPAGALGSINSTTCVLTPDVVLVPGGNSNPDTPGSVYSCTFKASVTGGVQSVTDIVTFFGHDANNKATKATDSAQVSISDVPPSVTVVKSLDGIACADVNYRVKVTNTDAGDADITLSSLVDNQFGNIASLQGSVLSTTCAVPQTIGKVDPNVTGSGIYECTFRAHFCGTSNTDVVTATVHDGDNPATNVTADSNSLKVTISATVGP